MSIYRLGHKIMVGAAFVMLGTVAFVAKTVQIDEKKAKQEIENAHNNNTVEIDLVKKTVSGNETALKKYIKLDSIKTEGAVKKAYFEGQQAIRDSIKLAKQTAIKLK